MTSDVLRVLKKAKLLYVEDDKSTQIVTLRVLNRYFDNIIVASDGKEALDILDRHKFDVALLDIVMPKLSGWDVIARIREFDKDMPIVVLSGNIIADELIYGIRLNITDYLPKPYSEELFNKAMARTAECLVRKFDDTQICIAENVYFDVLDSKVFNNGIEIPLTQKETIFLQLLSSCNKRIVTYNMIEESVYYDSNSFSLSAIKTLVLRLRKKIGQNAILNISGLGYKLARNS